MALQFTDKELLPWHYRQKFLFYTELHAPEVLTGLKKLCPLYDAVINRFPYCEYTTYENGKEIRRRRLLDYCDRREFLDSHNVKDRYQIIDPNDLPEAEEKAWQNYNELKTSFTDFLKTYGLTTDWLSEGLFYLLGKLTTDPQYHNSLCYAYSHAYSPAFGDEINLRIDGWQIKESWDEFELRARRQFETVLTEHQNATTKMFRESGYKQTTKPLDFTSVMWLVLWTVKGMSKAEILELIDKENEASGKTYDQKSLEKAFRKLKGYGLPVRKGNKSMVQKTR